MRKTANKRALLVLLRTGVVVFELAVIKQDKISPFPAALHVLDLRIPRLFFAHIALLYHLRDFLIYGTILLFSIKVDLHFVSVNKFCLRYGFIEPISPFSKHV